MTVTLDGTGVAPVRDFQARPAAPNVAAPSAAGHMNLTPTGSIVTPAGTDRPPAGTM